MLILLLALMCSIVGRHSVGCRLSCCCPVVDDLSRFASLFHSLKLQIIQFPGKLLSYQLHDTQSFMLAFHIFIFNQIHATWPPFSDRFSMAVL